MLANVSYSFEFYAIVSNESASKEQGIYRTSLRFFVLCYQLAQMPTKYPKNKTNVSIKTFNCLLFVFWSCEGYLPFADE